MIKADEQLAARLQAKEQEQFSIEEKSRMLVEMIPERKKFFAAQRAPEQRSKPPTKTQIRNKICTYLKNMGGYRHNHSVTRTEGSSKRAVDELESGKSKMQKIDEHVEAEKDDDQEEAEMKKHIEIVKDDEVAIDAIPLAIKPLMIVEYKINIDKEDLKTLWKLVKAKHGNTRPEEDYERVLWGDLKVIEAPYCDDTIKALEAKNPYKSPSYMPSITFYEPPLVAETDNIFGCIKSFPKCTSCGRDGLRATQILCINVERGSECREALRLLHSVNRVLSEYHNDGSIAMLTEDFSIPLTLYRSALLYEVRVRGDEGDDGVNGSVVGVAFGGGGIDEVVVVAMVWRWGWWVMVWRVGDDVGGGGRRSPKRRRKLREEKGLSLRGSIKNVDHSLETYNGDLLLYSFDLVVWVCTRKKWFPPMFLWSRGPNLGSYKTTSYVTVAYVVWMMIMFLLWLVFEGPILGATSFNFSGFTNKDIAPFKAQQIRVSVLVNEMVKDMEVHFDMTMRRKAVFECLGAPHAQDFLLAITIDKLDQHISPLEYRTILKYRLMITFSVDVICLVCRKACLDSFGEHAVHCKDLPGFKYRHDMVRDVLFDISRRAGISVKKEAHMGWKETCVRGSDRVSRLVGLSSRGFTAGQAALKAASYKVTKHEKACIENQHVIITFAFDTFGFLAPEAVELLS
ncbi:hypothetical protein Tco_0811023 [Tanacetum coccineum]